ncbi:hypothetical protein ACWGH2_29065 [Streptomyces sp. NPDC054871]
MDLHAWITQQVDTVERDARYSLDEFMFFDCGDQAVADHYMRAGSPEAVLRRCEADRRILARHRVATEWSWAHEAPCHGCGTEGHCDDPVIENNNDCPELLDLGRAFGLTDDILAELDRPQPPEPKRSDWLDQAEDYLHVAALGRGTPPITTSDVPEALRGPHWKP